MSDGRDTGNNDGAPALRRAWERSLGLLATKVSRVTFETYIKPTRPLSYEGRTVTLGVASPFAREWLSNRAGGAIRSALEFQLDTVDLHVEFVVLSRAQLAALDAAVSEEAQVARAARAPQMPLPLDGGTVRSVVSEIDASIDVPTQAAQMRRQHAVAHAPRAARRAAVGRPVELPPVDVPTLPLKARYSFENFLVGKSNRLAHAAALAVAERPGDCYNPLFVYGGPGLGKTHLLQAVALRLRENRPGLRTAFVSGEFFTQHYVSAIRESATEMFRRQHREVDVWLVDDIQFLSGKEQTKEEFFHTFNALYQTGKQIVLASDRSPTELTALEDRLRTRFQSGLIADVAPPDIETRIGILQHRCEQDGVRLPNDVIDYVAEAIPSNIRALEGALVKLLTFSSVMSIAIDVDLARKVLGEYMSAVATRPTHLSVDEVIRVVGARLAVLPGAIKGAARNREVVRARHVAMYLCRELIPGLSTAAAGAAFGGRDHATVVFACAKIKTEAVGDDSLSALLASLRHQLLTGSE